MIDTEAFWSYVRQQEERLRRLKDLVDRVKAGKKLGSDDELWIKQRMSLDADTMAERNVTKADIALVFRRSKLQVQKYRDAGMPQKDDLYPLVACIHWFIEQQIKPSQEQSTLDEQETRERIRKLQIQNAAASKQSVDRDASLRHVERGISQSRGILETFPRRAAALVPQEYRPEVEAAALDLVCAVLRSLEDCKNFASGDVIEPEAAQPEPEEVEETQP